MITYRITTLVDITKSNARRDDTDLLAVSQQSNFNTLAQTVGLRANIEWGDAPEIRTGAIKNLTSTEQRYWQWDFFVDKEAVFAEDDDPVGLLKQDLQGVPVIINLTETAKIVNPAFVSMGKHINIHIELL